MFGLERRSGSYELAHVDIIERAACYLARVDLRAYEIVVAHATELEHERDLAR
jgi:hypothetical protein